MIFRLAVFALLGLPLAALGEGDAVNAHGVDFSGHWELDYRLSDQVEGRIRAAITKAKADYVRQLERAMADRRRRVWLDTNAGNFQSLIGLGKLAEKITQATLLDIVQDGERIVINRHEDFALVCDFKSPGPVESPIGLESCGWQDDQLAFEIRLSKGLAIRHLLSLVPGRGRLHLATTVKLAALPYPFTLNRVFLPYQPGKSQYQCEYTLAKKKTCSLVGERHKETRVDRAVVDPPPANVPLAHSPSGGE